MLWNVLIFTLTTIAASDGYTEWIYQSESDFLAKETINRKNASLTLKKYKKNSGSSKIVNLLCVILQLIIFYRHVYFRI